MIALLDLKDLRCFVTAYELGGFARAAKELHTAQSNVSAHIHRLEEMIGEPLFVRLHRRIQPTAKGDLLYQHAKRVLDQVGELRQEITVTNRAA